MATTTNQGFQRGFLLSDSKSQKPVEKRKKKTPVTKKASDGFQSGFLLDNRKTKTTANETKKPKSSPPAKSYGGFSRGFLNSAATKKKKVSTNDDVKQRKKEVVVVSQELLDIGDDGPSMREKKNPFFISSFEHNQNQAKDGKSTQKSPIHPRQPLISILQSDTTAQPEEKSPSPSLISVVDDDGANDVITHHSSQQPKAHDGKKERIINLNEQKTTNPLILEQQEEGERTPLWTEVTTRRRELGRFQEPLIGNNFQESSTVTIEQSIESNQTTSSKLPEDIPTNDILLDDKPSLFRFQQKLESLVWQLQQQHEKDQPSAFAKEWSPTHFSWAWEWAFGDGKQNAHRVHGRGTLAVSLFQSNPVSILSVVRSQTQAERVVTLKAVQFLQEFFSGQQQHQKNHLPCSRGTKWVKELVSTLLSLADQPRRTLLAQECWKSTVFILSSVCETIYNDAHEQNEREWIEPGMMEQLERILQLKLSWTLSKKKISAKDQVMISILDDWKRVNRTCQNKMTNTLWCEQLAGQSTRGYSHWGGLRQTLCSDDAISITTTTAETIEVAMTSGLQDEFQERSRLRGVLATVTAKKRNHHPLGRFVNVSLQMLAKTKAPETIDLLLSLLNFIWSESNGLPPDILSTPEDSKASSVLPKSMEALLDSLDSLLDDKATPNTQDAIATLVARCILAHHDSLRLAKIVVQKLGTMKMSTIHILIALVTGADGPIRNDNVPVNIGGDNIEDDQCVLLYAVDILIANISSSAYLRERLRATDGAILTRGIPSALTVPKLLGILSTIPKRTQWDDISSSVGVTLSSLMEREVTLGHYDELVNQIVDALGKIAEKAKDDAQKGVGRVCSVFGGRWRRALLERKEFKLEAFGDMLVACSRVMFAAPASMVPLTFFGALVGENVARESLTTSNAQSRTLLAVNKLIMLSLAKLKEHGKIDGPDSVFSRLSPLLMLRRVPTIYFQVAREKSRLQEADELQRCSSYLADELATRLEIGNAEDYNVDFSAQERRLSAEIAGRCLGFGELYDNVGPYGMSNSGSVFQRICSPAFTTFLSGISAKGKTTFLRSIRCARAALYAMCIHIPFLKGDEIYYEDVYRLTASFALDVISIDVDQIEQVLSNDLVQLQTGCIEFFAICVEKTLEIQLTKGSVHTKKLVEQVSEFNDQKSSSGLLTFSTFNSMVEICRAVITITQTGKCDDAWIRSGKLHFAGDVARAVTDPPLSAKTCLWNSLIVVAQRCREDTGSLRAFSTSTLSWVTAWGRKSKSDDDIHHPLCAAAALQLTFILVTRCKSLKCFAEEDGTSKQNVRQAHQWALESVKDERALNDNYANRSLRMAALKLLLAIVTVDSMDSDGSVLPSCLGPGELGKTFTVVHGLSNMDPSPDVRKLASHILGVLRHD